MKILMGSKWEGLEKSRSSWGLNEGTDRMTEANRNAKSYWSYGQLWGDSQEGSPLLRICIHLWLPWLAQTASVFPVFLRALLKFLPLHICCCCPREFCQAFQVSIWCCSLLPKHCLGKTMFMHTIQVNTQVGSLKKLQKTFYKLLHTAQRPCHGEEAVCILPRAHRDPPVPKKLWNA